MTRHITGLHHVTSLASDAQGVNDFFTGTLGLRRVKKTVNFDAPDVYHLYFGDGAGTPGSVMTHFPFPHAAPGRRGTGEAGTTAFAVPVGALPYWHERLTRAGLGDSLEPGIRFGEARLGFAGPDGDGFALVEVEDDDRTPWEGADIPSDVAIRGFHSVELVLREINGTARLLGVMGYEDAGAEGETRRLAIPDGNGAHRIDLTRSSAAPAVQGAGSVHHVAFAVEDRAAQAEVRDALTRAGFDLTPPIDRDYFWAVYFRSPGGVLFEIATAEPGFDRDETPETLGTALKLPTQHEHLRDRLEGRILAPIVD
ncbi:glyoxalase family protein [Roseivivax marinus]|uniref:VOC family protein n=1 Tax=Roseivivax marinus TaxID=1379903 RepID=UPI0008CECDE9|nr:VOC family protein [Roseivivax marinus]SEK56922.1 glyoxalase family protein [Roseivivax marinus]